MKVRGGRWIGTAALVVAIAIAPALALGGKRQLVDKDRAKGSPAVAVARGTVTNPGKLRLVISTKPRRKRVAWDYTTDCVKDGREYEYPPPGSAEDKISRSKVRKTMRTVVDNPDRCRVAAAAKLQSKRGRVTVKIFNKR